MKSKNILIVSVIIISLGVAAGFGWFYLAGNKTIEEAQEANVLSALERTQINCESSGGIILYAVCCPGVSDFPDLCRVGACGCSPDNSHPAKTCECGPDRCFNGQECVPN